MGVLCVPVSAEEYNTSIQEKLPLIIGSAAAGLVFLIALVVIIIVCNRYVKRAHILVHNALGELSLFYVLHISAGINDSLLK